MYLSYVDLMVCIFDTFSITEDLWVDQNNYNDRINVDKKRTFFNILCDFSSLFKQPQLHNIKLRRSRRCLTRRVKSIMSVSTKNLFPVQIFPFQDSLSLRVRFLFSFSEGSFLPWSWIFIRYISHIALSTALLWRSISLSRPHPLSILCYFATPRITYSGVFSPFSQTILPILSSPSRVPPRVFDLIFLACCLTSIPSYDLPVQVRHSC